MNSRDKNIKILAISLAIFLIAIIVSSILNVISLLLGMNYINDDSNSISKEETFINESFIKNLDIDLNYTSLEIKVGSEFKIDKKIVKDNITTETKGNVLKIKEKNKLFWRNNGVITIYIPKNKNIDELNISIGAGKLYIDEVSSNKLKLDLGAGHSNISNSYFEETDIDSGAGKLVIENSTLKNLDADLGVGHIDMEAYVLGNSKIEAGIGKLELKLLGNKDDYYIETEKGIGSINIDGQDFSTVSYGKNKIKIEGGIGSIDVSFKN